MSRVLMLVINPMTADTRVEKEAGSLVAAGHEVTVVAIHADGLPVEEERDGYTIVRVPYRRVVKERVLAPAVRLRSMREERARALDTLRRLGAARPRPVAATVWLLRRLLVRAWILTGGAVLKTVRTRMLVPEYWGSVASGLPDRLPRPDVIHAHDLGPLAAAARLARSWPGDGPRPRVVYDSHELYVEQQTSWTRREKLAWKAHERRWIRHADLVVTVSESIAAELARRYRLPEMPTVVLNSPPDVPAPARSDVRSDAGVPEDVVLAVYVGTVKPGRGVDRLVPALGAGEWHLAIVGGGDESALEPLLTEADRVGARDRLHVLPGVPAATLPGYLATADVGVHPMERTCLNHELALPNKLVDYLCAGLPVAVSDLVEMRRLVESHQLGTTFDPTRPQDVSASLLEAVADHPRSHRPVAAADLLEQLGWGAQARRLVTAYERL
jgi:glycosyltransferase involved in cell wall biosynthesis